MPQRYTETSRNFSQTSYTASIFAFSPFHVAHYIQNCHLWSPHSLWCKLETLQHHIVQRVVLGSKKDPASGQFDSQIWIKSYCRWWGSRQALFIFISWGAEEAWALHVLRSRAQTQHPSHTSCLVLEILGPSPKPKPAWVLFAKIGMNKDPVLVVNWKSHLRQTKAGATASVPKSRAMGPLLLSSWVNPWHGFLCLAGVSPLFTGNVIDSPHSKPLSLCPQFCPSYNA